MSKRELIDYICQINKTAKPEFLADFSEEDLSSYLDNLLEINAEDMTLCVCPFAITIGRL